MTVIPPPYQPNAYAQTQLRPPLTATAKRGTRLAGMIGFNLLSIGWTLFIVPIAIGLFAGFFLFIFGQMGRSSSTTSSMDYERLRTFIDTMNIGVWVIPLVVVSLIGLVIWGLAIFTSVRILKSHGVNKPAGVTWAAAGIAVVASWFIGWIGSSLVQIISALLASTNVPMWTAILVTVGIAFLVSIAVNAVIGWLAWWWMAHAMRPRAAV